MTMLYLATYIRWHRRDRAAEIRAAGLRFDAIRGAFGAGQNMKRPAP